MRDDERQALRSIIDELRDRLRQSEERVEALRKDQAALRAFYEAYEMADASRGCFSCTPQHDCRCELDRGISKRCTCGRAELNAAENALEAADARARELGAIE